MKHYARGPNARGEYQLLIDHCRGVQQLVRAIGESLGLPRDVVDFVVALAPYHDIAKAARAWQHYFLHGGSMVPHAPPGARYLLDRSLLAAYYILKHHTGIRGSGENDLLRLRYDMEAEEIGRCQESVEWAESVLGPPKLPPPFTWRDDYEAYCKFRMGMALLVRADHHNSREHAQAGAPLPTVEHLDPKALASRCDEVRDQLVGKARRKGTPEDVINMRSELYSACAKAGTLPMAQVYLYVAPTGSGKTLSSVRFAASTGASRVIYVSPYLVITDQTQIFLSKVLGQRVMDHTSHTVRIGDPAIDEQIRRDHHFRADWDHPQINTTTERLSQVLFGPRTMDVRRFLSLFVPGTLMVLDEVHTIPPPKLRAYLRMLLHTRCRVLLSSANLDAARMILAEEGIEATQIAEVGLPRTLRRFEYEPCVVPEGPDPTTKGAQVVSIYNRIDTCCAAFFKYAAANKDAFLFHNNMCTAHRRDVEQEVRRRLDAGEAVFLFATQGIEVGIDLDFPQGLRQIGPIQNVIQGGGRVNREGKLTIGIVTIWYPPKWLSTDHFPRSLSYRTAAGRFWTAIINGVRPHDDAGMKRLAGELDRQYVEDCRGPHIRTKDAELTDHGVEGLIRARPLSDPWYAEEIARKLTLIENDPGKIRVLVNYKGAADRILQAPAGTIPRQDYEDHAVDIWEGAAEGFVAERDVLFAGDKRPTTIVVWMGVYDPHAGLGG